VGDDRVFHRLPRVDIEIALPAIKPSLGKSYQPLFRHKPILQQRGVFNVQVFRTFNLFRVFKVFNLFNGVQFAWLLKIFFVFHE